MAAKNTIAGPRRSLWHCFLAPVLFDGNARLRNLTVTETASVAMANRLCPIEVVDLNEKLAAAQWGGATMAASNCWFLRSWEWALEMVDKPTPEIPSRSPAICIRATLRRSFLV